MQFTQSELIAIAKMALDISKADGLRHQKETDADQQTLCLKIKGDMNYANNRQCCSGRIQCRN